MFDMYCSHFGCLAQFIRDYPKSTAKVKCFHGLPGEPTTGHEKIARIKNLHIIYQCRLGS